ncbi:hypothetical protein NDU88_004117 [Pleurodeles waltl]|uniref:Uncharacterized protein n=1 Tax=Pleurodeles waltl TaxID=8319 RepID=A0AAV7MTY1_PLEWA|nr:hypothetical protein NDU88_004117 [Pleurodeles waltl]
MEPSKVVKALKVLQDEGREDLIKEGVLEEAWVGLRRPKRLSADGVSAAVAACASPLKTCKKFRSKSATGRKVARSPEMEEVARDAVLAPQSLGSVRGCGASSPPRRQGSSLLRRVTAGGRGSGLVPAVKVGGRMGAQVRFAHARIRKTKQARSPLERGVKRDLSALEERPLGGTSNMAANSVDSQPFPALEERTLGTPVKMAAPVFNVEDEVVVISDEEEDAQVKPGAVYPTSLETAGVRPWGPLTDSDDAQPSTSQGAGAGWTSMDEDLLDYEDDMEEPVRSLQRVVMAGDVPGVVRGGHSTVHRRDMLAGNLPRGEDGLVGSVRVNELQDNLGGLRRTGALNVKGGSREQRMSKVDASIQVASGPDKMCAVWIVGHSFVRWVEKQASLRHFGRQVGQDGARIKISWVELRTRPGQCRSNAVQGPEAAGCRESTFGLLTGAPTRERPEQEGVTAALLTFYRCSEATGEVRRGLKVLPAKLRRLGFKPTVFPLDVEQPHDRLE